MKKLFKTLIIGLVIMFAPQVYAEQYQVLVLPDNIVTENAAIDSFIYDATSEFFADEIINLLNSTDYIKSQSVSQVRSALKSNPGAMLSAKDMTAKFKTTYNIDFVTANKIASKTNSRYILLLTSSIDSQNFILRRTLWDFLNIPGASVVDPAYKICTYAALIDTKNNQKLWADTYYKTISTVENRIITQGPSPQTVQLEKIKDYSRYICPQIARQVQIAILPAGVYAGESKQITCDMGNIDNVFTKKYRQYGKETKTLFKEKKESYAERKARRAEAKARKEAEKRAKLEVEAKQVYEGTSSNIDSVKNTVNQTQEQNINNINYEKTDFDSIDIRKTRKNNLFGGYESDKLPLRDYYK